VTRHFKRRRFFLLLALLPLASACTRTAVEPLGRPYIRPLAGRAVPPPAAADPARGPAGVPVDVFADGTTARMSAAGTGVAGLTITHHRDVIRFMERFAYQQPDVFAGWLARRARYEAMILPHLAAHGVPADMVHLALIESGYEPDARSHADAVGMWQFIASTARLEGLEVSAWVDDRRDPERATVAAARHLAGLYERFGSWYLAAAAYNGGAGRVERALDARAGGARGADSLFWLIQPVLPLETREYVPKLLAASLVGRSPTSFGIAVVAPEPLEPLDTVLVAEATELELAAAMAGVDPARVRRLNARYVRGSTPPGRSAPIVLPRGAGQRFLDALAARPQPAPAARDGVVGTLRHEVRAGETVWSIARNYDVHPHDLLRWNALTLDAVIRPGDRLRLGPPH